MSGDDRLEEIEMSPICQVDSDCAHYPICQQPMTCHCLTWGKCEVLRFAGQSCQNNLQCASGLLCRETNQKRISYICMPITQLADLRMFPDQPEDDMNSLPEIKASYGSSFLVAGIGAAIVLLCVILAIWYRWTPSTTDRCDDIEMKSPSSVLVNMNSTQQLSTYESTKELRAPRH